MQKSALAHKFNDFTSGFSGNGLRSATLPAYYYYDPDIFAAEKEQIWCKSWQYVGYLGDLAEPGDYITANILDQLIFVTRAAPGELRAFYNVCMHRGHTLVEGKGNKRIITCPFHAWSYDSHGNLKAAGNAENVAGFRHEDFHLSEIQVEAFGPMVYVNLDPSAPSLASQAGGLLERFRAVIPGFDDLHFAQRTTFPVEANWKFILDGMECYHCPVIHPQQMADSDASLTTSWESREEEFWQEHRIIGNRDLIENQKDKLPYDFGDAEIVDVYIWYLWPNMVFTAEQGPPNFMILHALSISPETCERHVINLCQHEKPTEHDRAQFDNYTEVVFPQDRAAIEGQALGVKSLGYTQGRLMVDAENSWRSEHGTHHFDDLVWRALNGDNYEVS